MDYPAYQVGRQGSLPPSTKVLHGSIHQLSNFKAMSTFVTSARQLVKIIISLKWRNQYLLKGVTCLHYFQRIHYNESHLSIKYFLLTLNQTIFSVLFELKEFIFTLGTIAYVFTSIQKNIVLLAVVVVKRSSSLMTPVQIPQKPTVFPVKNCVWKEQK